MTPPAPSKTTWRWKSTVWCIIGISLTFLIYQCFLEDQRQSGSYGCEMSYMWPTYHPVDWPDNPSKKYSLYLYREQGWDGDDRVSLFDLLVYELI
jgi:glycosylphosphatidylinositol deacylase